MRRRDREIGTRPQRSGRALWVLSVALAGAFLLPSGAWAQSAWDILERTIQSEGGVNYRATVEIGVFENGRQVGTRTQRLFKAEGNRKRIESLSGRGLEGLIVSNGRYEWEYRQASGTVRQRELLPVSEIRRLQQQTLDAVRDTLHPVYEGEARIAGRKCYVVAVKPPTGVRTRKRMWVDASQFTELKSIRYGPAGGIMATWMVKEVKFGARMDPRWFEFVAPQGCRVFRIPVTHRVSLSTAEERAGFNAVLPGWAPEGYVFLREQAAVFQMGPRTVLWLQWSDGVENYSIFESPSSGRKPKEAPGTTVWEAQGRYFVLTGWLGPEDRRKIRESTEK
jgi:negative regulator of sigma E activity